MAAESPAESTSMDSPLSLASVSGGSRVNRLAKRKRSKRHSQLAALPSSNDDDDEYIALCLLMLSGGSAAGEEDAHSCTICGKSFASYHALGGHMTSHRKPLPSSVEDRLAPGSQPFSSGGKVHLCLICLRTFTTGQALGGHKRRHYDGTIGSAAGAGLASEGMIGGTGRGLGLDLNLPAVEDFTGSAARRCLEEEEEMRTLPLKKTCFFLTA